MEGRKEWRRICKLVSEAWQRQLRGVRRGRVPLLRVLLTKFKIYDFGLAKRQSRILLATWLAWLGLRAARFALMV